MADSPYVKDVDTAGFQQEVVDRSREVPVVVDFWAAWCGPCKALGPLLEKLAAEHQGGFELARVDVDANQQLAAVFGVQGIPTVVGFREGKAVSQFTGAIPEANLRQWLEEVIPSEADLLVAAADGLVEDGDPEAAERGYLEALGVDPRHVGAGVGLASLLVEADRFAEALEVLAPLSSTSEVERLRATARLGSAEDASVPDLQAKLAEEPGDAQVRIELSLALAAQGSYQEALDHLLEVVRAGDESREEARLAILDIFGVLGDEHPLTGTYRRELANALF